MNAWVTLSLISFLVAMNTACFLVWAIDKERARRRTWRIREQNMLLLAAFGGLGGALIGHWYFRHKLRKRSFTNAIYLIALIECFGLFWLFTHT